jgi:ferritin-like metal-binding protein YciE
MAKQHPPNEHLVDFLSDAYSMEQQALAQLRTAPDVAEEPGLAAALRTHLVETEGHAERVRQRLEAHGGSPSRIKDAVMRLGGKGFLLFARVQPDTPGKLTAHAHSYEAMEWAAYEALSRLAERVGDAETARVAREIRDEEGAMRERLAGRFDAVVEASLRDRAPEQLRDALRTYLADAHAIEEQSIQLLERAPDITGDVEVAGLYREHLAESREHAGWIEQRLEALGGDPSTLKDAAMRLGALEWSLFFQAQRDTPIKLAVFAYAFEHLEIAGHELLRRVATRAADPETIATLDRILPQERSMADRLVTTFDRALEATLPEVAGKSS